MRVVIVAVVCVLFFSQSAWAHSTSTWSKALYKVATDEFVLRENVDQSLPIASITKLMTALVAYETFPEDTTIRYRGTNLLLDDALHILLIASNNHMANVITDRARTRSAFVFLMNQRATTLGMTASSFVDPSGLGAGNKSSARDLVKLALYIDAHAPRIFEISRKPNAIVYSREGRKFSVLNTNKLLWGPLYPGKVTVLGSKTGWTLAAGGCLLMVFEADGRKYVAVVLGFSGKGRFRAMKQLIKLTL